MRGPVILLGAVVALFVAAARAMTRPFFAPESVYATLPVTITHAQLYVGIRLALFLLLIATVYLIYRKYDFPDEGLLVLIASPAFLIAPIGTDLGLGVALLVAAGVLAWESNILLVIIAALLALMHPVGWLLALLAVPALFLRKAWPHLLVLVLALAAGVYTHGVTVAIELGVSEIGALGAPSVFISLLAIMGVLSAWRPRTYPRLLIASVAVAGGMLIPGLRLSAAIGAAILAGYAVQELRERHWRLEGIRNISLLFVVLGLVFTAASTGAQAVRSEPSPGMLSAAQFLRQAPPGAVFALPQHVATLRWYGIDATSANLDTILASRNLDVVGPLLPKYVLLARNDQAPALRFLIENTNGFQRIHSGDYDIWEVV